MHLYVAPLAPPPSKPRGVGGDTLYYEPELGEYGDYDEKVPDSLVAFQEDKKTWDRHVAAHAAWEKAPRVISKLELDVLVLCKKYESYEDKAKRKRAAREKKKGKLAEESSSSSEDESESSSEEEEEEEEAAEKVGNGDDDGAYLDLTLCFKLVPLQ